MTTRTRTRSSLLAERLAARGIDLSASWLARLRDPPDPLRRRLAAGQRSSPPAPAGLGGRPRPGGAAGGRPGGGRRGRPAAGGRAALRGGEAIERGRAVSRALRSG